MHDSGAIFVIIIVLVVIFLLTFRRGKHQRTEEALNSPYRDKKLYYNLLGAQLLNKALILAFIVTMVVMLLMPKRQQTITVKVPLAEEQQEEKNVTYEGNKRVVHKPPKWDK